MGERTRDDLCGEVASSCAWYPSPTCVASPAGKELSVFRGVAVTRICQSSFRSSGIRGTWRMIVSHGSSHNSN